jgi:hypothetical protein
VRSDALRCEVKRRGAILSAAATGYWVARETWPAPTNAPCGKLASLRKQKMQ